ERARRQRAHADDADGLVLRARQKALEVDARELPCLPAPGRGIEQVVEDLRGVDGARVDHRVDRVRITDRGEAEEPRLALLAQSLKRWNHLVHHRANPERAACRRGTDRIVELKEVDARSAEPPEAVVDRARDSTADVPEILGPQAYLRADVH